MASQINRQDNINSIEVFTTKNRGRGVRVTSDVKVGTLLMTDTPFEFVLKNSERGRFCDTCLAKRDEILHKCSACKFAYYCNRECQRAAWSSHKFECEAVNRVNHPKMPSDHVRLMARLCRKRKKYLASTVNSESEFPSHVDQLQSLSTDVHGDTQLEFFSWLYTLRVFMGSDANAMLPADILELFGRMRCNACDMSDWDLHSVGIGLYLRFSMFNHSCASNCIAIHNGTTLCIRATSDIPAYKECFVSYVDAMKPTSARNSILRNVFQFTCKCNQCRDTNREQLRHSLRCGSLDCKEGVLLNPDGTIQQCSSCNFGFPVGFADKLKSIEEHCATSLARVEELISHANWKEVMELCERCLALQNGVLHPSHHLVVETLNYTMDACIQAGDWHRAVDYGLQSIQQLGFHCPGNSAAAAIQLMRVGKIELYLDRMAEAFKHLRQAESILAITHGPEHPLYISLTDMLTGCEMTSGLAKLPSIEETSMLMKDVAASHVSPIRTLSDEQAVTSP